MPFEVREESPHDVRETVVQILSATRSVTLDDRHFDWLYLRNPDGPAVLWTIRDTSTDTIAGFTVALPRRMLVDGQPRTCWNCADFSILPKYRSLGVAIKLRRAAKDGVDAGRVDFLYAHPNEKMAVVHKQVGHQPLGRMLRYACVLRSAPYLERKVHSHALATAIGTVVDPLLRIAARDARHDANSATRVEPSPSFDERFDQLHASTAPIAPVYGLRDARYLTWRYGENPLYQTHAILAETEGRLDGYLLFAEQDGVGYVKDIFPPGDPGVVSDLLAALVREGRARHWQSASVTLLADCPLEGALDEFGFKSRPDSSEMMWYAPLTSPSSERLAHPRNWFVTVGDRDV
jgi:hypothetical protein